MVFMPPRHGKSEEVSRLFSAYYLLRHPEHFVGLSSYSAHLALQLSRAARANYRTVQPAVARESDAVTYWTTPAGGGMWAAGVGGSMTGMGAHLLTCDDPVKDAAEARSDLIKSNHREWWRSTWRTRLEPEGARIVVQTRWALDDLAGWLLDMESGEEPERWHIVSLPAIAETDPTPLPPSCTVEPDWREPGEALCPERYPVDVLRQTQSQSGAHVWAALYQQRPRAAEGNRFKWDWFRIVDATPAKVKTRVRSWDLAGTDDDGDYTAGALLSLGDGPAPQVWIEDVTRGQWSPARRAAHIVDTATRDKERYGRVQIRLEKDTGIGGTQRTNELIRALHGFEVIAEPAVGDKPSRAEPLASQAEAGNVNMVRGEWNRAALIELTDFPFGTNDDQVDAMASAYNKAAEGHQQGAATAERFW